MKKMIIAAALTALLASPALAQSGNTGAPSGANTNKAQGFQGAQPPSNMRHYRSSSRHMYRHDRHHYHHHMSHHMSHHRHHAM